MPHSSEKILWTRDIADAAKWAPAVVLLADLGDLAFRALTHMPPTPEDRLRAEAYASAAKPRFLARRALLRQLVGRRLGLAAAEIVVVADEMGAPRLAAPNKILPDAELFLSVASRAALAAFALALRPIGVDIEILGPAEAVPAAMLHKAEAERLAALDEAARHKAFLEIWTLKEAYLKALRAGLSREPAQIEVRFEAMDEIRLFDRGRPVATTACACRTEALGRDMIIAACVML